MVHQDGPELKGSLTPGSGRSSVLDSAKSRHRNLTAFSKNGRTSGPLMYNDQAAPLSLGTAVHMATAAVRSHLYKDKGFVYVDTHESGTSSMYLSENFALTNFSAVLKIKPGRLDGFPEVSRLVRAATTIGHELRSWIL